MNYSFAYVEGEALLMGMKVFILGRSFCVGVGNGPGGRRYFQVRICVILIWFHGMNWLIVRIPNHSHLRADLSSPSMVPFVDCYPDNSCVNYVARLLACLVPYSLAPLIGNVVWLLQEVALSSGSACTSSSLEPSYVLRAIGVSEDLAHTSLR